MAPICSNEHDLESRSLEAAARETAEIVGLEPDIGFDDRLLEWDYGPAEGQRSVDMREQIEDWPATSPSSLMGIFSRSSSPDGSNSQLAKDDASSSKPPR